VIRLIQIPILSPEILTVKPLDLFRGYFLVLAIFALSVSRGSTQTLAQEPTSPVQLQQNTRALRTIGFMTDFDLKDDAVGICKAVMNGVAPGVQVIDITHQATPYDIAEGARFLAGSAPYFAKDAVFVVVIDPTVGSARRPIIARSKNGQFFVLPDNGLLTLVQDREGIEGVREITNPEWMIGAKTSSTFHGRDIFSPAGAHLARGDDWTTAGQPVDIASLVRLDLHTATVNDMGLHGEVIGTDGPFGNLVLNVPAETFAKLGYKLGDTVPVQVGGQTYQLPFVKTFSDVAVGKPLAYIDSRGRLSLGINQRSFAETYGIHASAAVMIARKP
jgi:S-adenosylmethionine hydrolase